MGFIALDMHCSLIFDCKIHVAYISGACEKFNGGMHLTQPNMLQIVYNTPVVADFKENEITVATASCSTG